MSYYDSISTLLTASTIPDNIQHPCTKTATFEEHEAFHKKYPPIQRRFNGRAKRETIIKFMAKKGLKKASVHVYGIHKRYGVTIIPHEEIIL